MRKTKKFLAILMSICLFLVGFAPRVNAAGERTSGTGKYVKDVFIAYGKTEKDAKQWLEANGWEVLKGNSNVGLGKASTFDDEIAAVMGIRRTDKVGEAITDMAIMNMKGGYSLAAYEALLDQKKVQINEYIDHFFPVVKEFRDNYDNKGSALGKKRADLAYSLLNKFYDGTVNGEYAVNDTGMPLGKLFLATLKQEMAEGEYEKLSAEEKVKHGDLQQLMLESTGPAMTVIRQLLALSTDTNEDTWLQRLTSLSGDDLKKNIGKYAPEAAGQDLAPSAIIQILNQHYGDLAAILSSQWKDIHAEMVWFENYCSDNDLWSHDGEKEDVYKARVKKYFDDLKKNDENRYELEYYRFNPDSILYENLFEVTYKGEWGLTLGDFFNPINGKNYGQEENFLTFAAAMSEGQRSAAELVSLQSLLLVGFVDNAGFEYALPDINKAFEGDAAESDSMDIYTGMNRSIFRNGVAMTSQAMMAQNMGRGQAFNDLFGHLGVLAITAYSAAIVGVSMMIAGGVMMAKGTKTIVPTTSVSLEATEDNISMMKELMDNAKSDWDDFLEFGQEWQIETAKNSYNKYKGIYEQLSNGQKYEETVTETITGPNVAGRWILGIGGVIFLAAAALEAWQLYMYYQHDMTPIPRMIVDEADIVSYEVDETGKQKTDENGNPIKNINFDQYVYYDAVKCNRPEVGEISDWQSGVKEYKDAGCYDIADLNGDYGQEWLALYTNKSLKKGDPILADSLVLQYGSDAYPKDAPNALHFFTYTYPVDLGDMAYSFNNKQNGIYLFWNADVEAGDKGRAAAAGTPTATASTFSAGQFALGATAGILLSLCGVAVVTLIRRKRKLVQAS